MKALWAAAVCCAGCPALAQESADEQLQPEPAEIVVPALTPVRIEVLSDLGSATSQSLQTFPIRLATPVMIDGRVAIPAGAGGQGEVVHAKRAGGSGTPGELVLAARWLEVGGRRVRLRSMNVALAGRSNIPAVDALRAASVASPLPIALIGFAVTGRNITYPKGTIADAKTAEAFAISASAGGLPAADNLNLPAKNNQPTM